MQESKTSEGKKGFLENKELRGILKDGDFTLRKADYMTKAEGPVSVTALSLALWAVPKATYRFLQLHLSYTRGNPRLES